METTALYQGTAFPAGAIVDGTLQFAGIQVYSVNGAVVTVKKLAVSCEVDRPAIEYAEGLETALTATDGKSGYADGDVIYYPAGDEDRVLTSADNNFRYTYLMIVDENGKIIEVGNNLVANNADFQGEITVPAGGFAISFFYNASSATANQALYDVYASLTGEKVDPAVFTIYNETIAVDGGDYVVSCDGENLKVTVGAEEEPDAPVAGKNWENTMVEGEDGNYSCEVPYGYTWNVNYVDSTIAGEDVTVCTTQDAYNVCNPNWAITVYLEKQADGTYVALQDAIVCPGSAAAAGITIGENQIALVAHSAYSNPNGSNWQGKVVAMSVKAGDVFTVSDDMLTVVAVDPNAAPETPDTPITGDTGILVFAVLAVVAIAGCAVASKIKSSAL